MSDIAPVLLKLSGEALKASSSGIFDPAMVARVGEELAAGAADGTPVAVVVGGGNIIRGRDMPPAGDDPTRGDAMGMLATCINALALKGAIIAAGGTAIAVGPQTIPGGIIGWDRDLVMAELARGTVVVFGGGTGHPFFTTDTAAALRAAQIGARALAKGSQVDGVYTADPAKDPNAERFDFLSFDDAIAGRYGVMDLAAFTLCREQNVPIRVFDMHPEGAIRAALGPNPPGTLVGPSEGASV
jgi:uridylate kinase